MLGVILARFQPIHNGHVALIEQALKSCDLLHVFIGSADKVNQRNPIPVDVREEYVKEVIKEKFPIYQDRIFIHRLDDLSNEANNTYEWGIYLYANIVGVINSARFTIFYSDGIDIITSWFYPWMLKNFVSLVLLARNSIEQGVSATKVRKAIIEGKEEDLKCMLPKAIYDMRNQIKHYIELSNYNR